MSKVFELTYLGMDNAGIDLEFREAYTTSKFDASFERCLVGNLMVIQQTAALRLNCVGLSSYADLLDPGPPVATVRRFRAPAPAPPTSIVLDVGSPARLQIGPSRGTTLTVHLAME